MRKSICALALVVASLGVGVPAAHADTNGCVSRGEFRRVHHPMREGRVHRIFDTRGRHYTGSVVEIRRYRGCPRGSWVSVSYRSSRMSTKIWLRG